MDYPAQGIPLHDYPLLARFRYRHPKDRFKKSDYVLRVPTRTIDGLPTFAHFTPGGNHCVHGKGPCPW